MRIQKVLSGGGGSNFDVFALYFCDEGKEDPDTTKSRPLFSRQQNAIKMAFHRRADDGPTLNAGLVAI